MEVEEWDDTPKYVDPITGAVVAFKHDNENLYIYAEWSASSPSSLDYFGVEFDNNGDEAHMGRTSSPDDSFFLSPSFSDGTTCARDSYLVGFAQPVYDTDVGGVNDYVGRMVLQNGTYFIEVKRPFETNDPAGHDVSFDNRTAIGVGFVAGTFGGGSSHSGTDMSTYRVALTNKTAAEPIDDDPVVPEISNLMTVAWDAGIILVVIAAALCVFHFVRRRAWRRSVELGEMTIEGPLSFVNVRRHELPMRALHWSHVTMMFALMVTGFGIHFKVYLLGSGTSLIHVMIGITILVVDLPVRYVVLRKTGDFSALAKPSKDDFVEMGGITKNFFGLTGKYPEHATYDATTKEYYLNRKYCSMQKAMLWGDLVAIVGIAVTGFALHNPELLPWVIDLFGGGTNIRALHLFTFFYFAATLIGHIYLSVIPYNWGKMRSMVTGSGLIHEHVPEGGKPPKAWDWPIPKSEE